MNPKRYSYLFPAALAVLVVLALAIMGEIQKGSYNAIMHNQGSHRILFIEVWYHPNGEISGIKF